MMNITTKFEADKLSWRFFGRALPMSHAEMKSAFRAAASKLKGAFGELASDLSMVEAKDRFIELNQFYKSLQDKPWAFTDNAKGSEPLVTVAGESLTELGLGLGPSKNGRDCGVCQHRGYNEERPEGWKRCIWCDCGWSYTQPCQRCQGTGNGPKQKPNACPQCKGKAVFHHHRAVKCRECKGVGGTAVKIGTVLYYMCSNCKGTGEIEIFNPVLPKGLLTSRRIV